MAQDLTLAIERRDKLGTTGARALRKAGKIPGILYGHGSEPQHIAFEARAFEELLHRGGRTALITLTLAGKNAETALVREMQQDPLSRRVLHADLQRVSANESVRSKLPLVAVGTAQGVREAGGVMDVVVHELEVEGPANRLPENLEVDVSALGIHEHATAADVRLPDGFKMITPPETIVVSIEPSKTARALEEAESGITAEQPAPEVIGEKPQGEGASA